MLKTPVSAINEICVKNKIIPHYNLVKTPPSNLYICDLTFEYEYGEIKVGGEGNTKKNAKHSAAYEALKIFCGEGFCQEFNSSYLDIDNIRLPHTEISENYVKKLRDLCACSWLPVPEYSDVNEVGIPDALEITNHTIRCSVSSVHVVCRSISKKLAKNNCANSMLNKIANITGLCLNEPKEIDGGIISNEITNGCDPKIECENKPVEDEVKENRIIFYDNIKSYVTENKETFSKINISTYHCVFGLEEDYFSFNYAVTNKITEMDDALRGKGNPMSVLQELSEISEKYFVFYKFHAREIYQKKSIDHNNNTINNAFCCILSLKTPQVCVVFGVGNTETTAQNDACIKMIRLLKVLFRPVENSSLPETV